MEKEYIINDCGVVMNPDVIFYFMPKGALAWCYWSLKVGKCNNGLWDYGYSIPAGASPCCIGKFSTKEEATEEAINFLEKWFKKGYDYKGLLSESKFEIGKIEFQRFLNKRFLNQKSQTDHLISIPDTGSNYVQGSLF